jgi:hypothetical protein
MSVGVGRGLRANRLVCGAVMGHHGRREGAATGAEKGSRVAQKRAPRDGAAPRAPDARRRRDAVRRALPPGTTATGCCEPRASNDARATGRGSTPVRPTAHFRVGDRRTRAAFRGLVVVGIIRCRSFGLCSWLLPWAPAQGRCLREWVALGGLSSDRLPSDGCLSLLASLALWAAPFACCDSRVAIRGSPRRVGFFRCRSFAFFAVWLLCRVTDDGILRCLVRAHQGRPVECSLVLPSGSPVISLLAAVPSRGCAFRPSVERSYRASHTRGRAGGAGCGLPFFGSPTVLISYGWALVVDHRSMRP